MKLDPPAAPPADSGALAADAVAVADSRVDAPIRVLVPDLPSADALLPLLRRIDETRRYTNGGPLVREYEACVASLIGPHDALSECIATSSGTAALELALAGLDLAHNTRVLVPAYTFPATANAVIRTGHVPVLCDVCPERWTLTPELARRLAERLGCGAVVPVAVHGCSMPVAQWDAFAESTGLPVLIDAAAALANVACGRRVVVAYSLHATKPLGVGEGGIIATRDRALASRVRSALNHGFGSHPADADRIATPGTNARLSEYAAAVGLAQLARWPSLLEQRRELWRRYRNALQTLPSVIVSRAFDDHPPAALTVMTDREAGAVTASLRNRGIQTRRWYHPPLHQHPAYASLPRASALPVVERLARHAIGLPFHTQLTGHDIERVVGALATR